MTRWLELCQLRSWNGLCCAGWQLHSFLGSGFAAAQASVAQRLAGPGSRRVRQSQRGERESRPALKTAAGRNPGQCAGRGGERIR